MKKLLGLIVAVGASALLYACGGDSNDQPLGVASNTTLSTNSTVAAAVVAVPFSFPTGVPDFGTTAATTLTFTSTSTAPAFSIASGGATATGTTSFGSCLFAVQASTFPAGSKLAVGQVITVNPCNVNVQTAGQQANGVGATRSVALVLGTAVASGQSITVSVNPGGQLTLNGTSVGQVTLVPITG